MQVFFNYLGMCLYIILEVCLLINFRKKILHFVLHLRILVIIPMILSAFWTVKLFRLGNICHLNILKMGILDCIFPNGTRIIHSLNYRDKCDTKVSL